MSANNIKCLLPRFGMVNFSFLFQFEFLTLDRLYATVIIVIYYQITGNPGYLIFTFLQYSQRKMSRDTSALGGRISSGLLKLFVIAHFSLAVM